MRKDLGHALVVGEALVAVNAVGGAGWLLAGGRGMDIETTRLPRLGIHRWWPGGVALLGTVAVPMARSAVLVARRAPDAPKASMTSGATLIGWVVAQRLLGVPASLLQPTLGTAGAAIAVGGWALAREERPGR